MTSLKLLCSIWADGTRMEITGRTGLNNDQKCIPACGEFRVLKSVGWGMDKSFTGARSWRILVKTIYARSVMIG